MEPGGGAGTLAVTARRGSGPTRREALAWTSAAAAAWALGCSPRLPGEPGIDPAAEGIGGRIVGASADRGHLLRRGSRHGDGPGNGLPEPTAVRDVPVVIAGGGLAGLSAGWELRRRGFDDFEILELEDRLGGKAAWGENAVTAYPWGSHYVAVPSRESILARELFEEMGLVRDHGTDGEPIYDPRHLCHAPQERILIDGVWGDDISARGLVPRSEAAELLAFEAEIARLAHLRDADGRPTFAVPRDLGSDEAELKHLDERSMLEDLDQRGFSSERLRWYVGYRCRDEYGATLDTTSAWAVWHYFATRPEELAYLTWPEGNGRVVRHLAARIGAERLHAGRVVYRVAPSRAGEGVDVDVWDVASETAVRLRARRLIYALPRLTARRVIVGYDGSLDDAFTYSPWVVANLAVRRLPADAAWDNVIYRSRSLGYVVATHQNLRTAPGASVLTYYLPLTGRDPAAERRAMLKRSWNDWAALILSDLSGAHPEIVDLVETIDVMLWGHAMIRPVPGFLWSEARRRALEPCGPIVFAHSDMSGMSVFEEAQYRGVTAARKVLAELG